MIKSRFRMGDGRVGILIGLSRANVDRLIAGEPIFFDTDQLALLEDDRVGGISVFFGETEDAMLQDLRRLVNPRTTTILSVPDGDDGKHT